MKHILFTSHHQSIVDSSLVSLYLGSDDAQTQHSGVFHGQLDNLLESGYIGLISEADYV
jgi:hypothetical protein